MKSRISRGGFKALSHGKPGHRKRPLKVEWLPKRLRLSWVNSQIVRGSPGKGHLGDKSIEAEIKAARSTIYRKQVIDFRL